MAVGSIQGLAAAPLTNLQPPPRPQGPPPQATAPAGVSDPADTNQDGVVSPEEAQAYAQTHPQAQPPSAPGTYSPQGTPAPPPPPSSALDLQA